MQEQMSSVRDLGFREFTGADQLAFAAFSGDVNPMHMDAAVARRLITGRQVVHGVHVFLAAAELWQQHRLAFPASVECVFNNPVSVGDQVRFFATETSRDSHLLEAIVDGVTCARITLTRLVDEDCEPIPYPDGENATPIEQGQLCDFNPAEQAGKSWTMDLPEGPESLFPGACAALGSRTVSAAAALSYFVGMVCPGLSSVFSSFTLSPASAESPIHFQLRRYDPRIRMVDASVGGPVRGSIRAFVRLPPQPQPSMAELNDQVEPREFGGTRSLVVGGSRGLGELTAKIIASGGGDVCLTYASGRVDAERVRDEIASARRGKCAIAELDLGGEMLPRMSSGLEDIDFVFFFATPRIFKKKSALFDRATFLEFCQFYLDRFHALCVELEKCERTRPVTVYLPSTVFISERPKGMTEYAMAKAAAEILAADVNRSFESVRVVWTRLPRLRTDQTSSLLKVDAESNVDVLLPLIRSLIRDEQAT